MLAAKTTQEFYDMPSAYYEKLRINRPKLVVNEEGTLMVKLSEEPYQPPPEPTEKEIGQSKDLLRRMREAAESSKAHSERIETITFYPFYLLN